MITDSDKTTIKNSWRYVVPVREMLPDLFYRRLFELAPTYRSLFSDDMTSQKRKLLSMLAFVVKSLDWPESAWRAEVEDKDDLFLVVLALGRRHAELYRVPDESYPVVCESLLWAMDYALGEVFDDDCKAAWTRVFALLSKIMLMASTTATIDRVEQVSQ